MCEKYHRGYPIRLHIIHTYRYTWISRYRDASGRPSSKLNTKCACVRPESMDPSQKNSFSLFFFFYPPFFFFYFFLPLIGEKIVILFFFVLFFCCLIYIFFCIMSFLFLFFVHLLISSHYIASKCVLFEFLFLLTLTCYFPKRNS